MITRQFVTLHDRQIHLRRAGDGPPVLLFHDLPNSSRILVPTIETVANAGFTALAPDLCGYGNSDALAGATTIEACAHVMRQAIHALGIVHYGVYGTHTGAVIAARLAGEKPHRVVAAVLNAYPLFDAGELVEYRQHFFPPFQPTWDGGHLAWAWARLREQMIFFPWYRPTAADRLSYDVPSPDLLHGRLLDWLRGIDGHAGLYRAVFNEALEPPLLRLRAPTVLAYGEHDVLAAHRLRLPPLPSGVSTQVVTGDRLAINGRLGEWLAAARALPRVAPCPPSDAWPDAPASLDEGTPPPGVAGRLLQQFVVVPGGQLALRRIAGRGRVCLLLHDAGSSSALLVDLLKSLGKHRPVLAPDLPGHGESTAPAGASAEVAPLESYLDPLLHLLALHPEPIDIVGFGFGAVLAIEIARRRPEQVANLAIAGLAPIPEKLVAELVAEGTPSLQARWDGTHLLTAWHRTRDAELFWPWYCRGRVGLRRGEPAVDPMRLQRAVTELLKSGHHYRGAWQIWAEYPAAERAARLDRRPMVLTEPDDPLRPWIDAWPGADVRRLRGRAETWGGAVNDLLG